MKDAVRLAVFALCGIWTFQCGCQAFAAAKDDPWAELTRQDVDAYCRDIRGIHPCMLDPYAPGCRRVALYPPIPVKPAPERSVGGCRYHRHQL